MGKQEIIKEFKGGNILFKPRGCNFTAKGRRIIPCKCGHYVDVWGAMQNPNRVSKTKWALRCKRCGRWCSCSEIELDVI